MLGWFKLRRFNWESLSQSTSFWHCSTNLWQNRSQLDIKFTFFGGQNHLRHQDFPLPSGCVKLWLVSTCRSRWRWLQGTGTWSRLCREVVAGIRKMSITITGYHPIFYDQTWNPCFFFQCFFSKFLRSFLKIQHFLWTKIEPTTFSNNAARNPRSSRGPWSFAPAQKRWVATPAAWPWPWRGGQGTAELVGSKSCFAKKFLTGCFCCFWP